MSRARDRELTRALKEAGQTKLAERARAGESDGGPHQFPIMVLRTALTARAVSDKRAEAMLTRLRRGEFDIVATCPCAVSRMP